MEEKTELTGIAGLGLRRGLCRTRVPNFLQHRHPAIAAFVLPLMDPLRHARGNRSKRQQQKDGDEMTHDVSM